MREQLTGPPRHRRRVTGAEQRGPLQKRGLREGRLQSGGKEAGQGAPADEKSRKPHLQPVNENPSENKQSHLIHSLPWDQPYLLKS